MEKVNSREARWVGLMRAAQQGDRAAYHSLLFELAPFIRGAIGRRWGRFEGIEDLVQDVLLSMHSVRHTYDPQRPFTPWLMAIARHRMADNARRYVRKVRNEVNVDEWPETFSAHEPNYLDEGPGDVQSLREAIAKLPVGQRQAVEMLKLQEMSLKGASAASGQSVAALKVAMHRALKALRAALGEERQG
ncbi:sigma-70 family RNA polymerase sigma factor [Methylocapsa aurea]|uniref:sigma-70 family RNA polymerase sigma factor n=1 Tax=Methylocapsa aurea TaxID=663610 RepID=UPI00055BBBB5|nr:sigma-70 family RNA polymerase sigma factor [Methylocapsa aurea]